MLIKYDKNKDTFIIGFIAFLIIFLNLSHVNVIKMLNENYCIDIRASLHLWYLSAFLNP